LEGYPLTQIELGLQNIKHIVCYSGGHSSALVALNVAKRYGTADLILLNHDISSFVEHQDIKRFKQEVADYLQVPITYANHKGYETKDQFVICVERNGFQFQAGNALCTKILKTDPFNEYLKTNFPNKDCIIYVTHFINSHHRIILLAFLL
jgi:3'-phosphoadenosine 5'-phosphosulfate sulfotransferase (PAPS reductase)/FAD synthetase